LIMSSFIKKLKKFLRIKSKSKTRLTGASQLLELKYGHYKSYKSKQSIGNNDQPIPWFTYPSIEYLDQFDFSNKIMLEWGSGNSSLWFCERVKKLFSIEHDKSWFEQVVSNRRANHEINHATDAAYVDQAHRLNQLFDIILIDGIQRSECSDAAIQLLKPDGFIILDNSDRYPDISQKLRDKGFIQVDFHGFGPINEYTWTTSLLLSRSVALLPKTIQPRIPIGGGY
jgi:hypothetical protein